MKELKKDHLELIEEEEIEATIIKEDIAVEEAEDLIKRLKVNLINRLREDLIRLKEELGEEVINKEEATKREVVIINHQEVGTEESHTIRETNRMITTDKIDMREDHMAKEKKNKIKNQTSRKIWQLEDLKLLPRDQRRRKLKRSHQEKEKAQELLKEQQEEQAKVEEEVSEETTEVVDNSNSNDL